jgi:predicted RNA-binding protein with TRAM domain
MSQRERKRKRSLIDEFFGDSLLGDIESLLRGFSEDSYIGGYSISVIQTPEGTRVKVKVSGDTDVNALRKQLERQYPGAKIEIEGGRREPLIKEVSTKPVNEGEEK